MSVLKSKRTESKAEYVNVANAIYIETINFLTRISARYSRLIAEPVAKLAGEVIDHAEKANSIYPSDAQRHQRYILNPDFRRIADTIIDTAPGEFPGRGMPLGVEPSQQEMAAMPSAVDNWIKCQMSTHSAGHYMDDYCIILPDIEDLKKLGRAIVRQFEIRGIPVNKKKCKIIPLTKPFRWCKARFTLTETGKIKVNGSRDGVIRARRKLKLFHREWLAGKRTLQEVAQYMNCQEAYYKNFDDHGRLLRLRRLCYAIFGGRVPCSTKSSKPVMAPSLP